jgi:hypothetical protein
MHAAYSVLAGYGAMRDLLKARARQLKTCLFPQLSEELTPTAATPHSRSLKRQSRTGPGRALLRATPAPACRASMAHWHTWQTPCPEDQPSTLPLSTRIAPTRKRCSFSKSAGGKAPGRTPDCARASPCTPSKVVKSSVLARQHCVVGDGAGCEGGAGHKVAHAVCLLAELLLCCGNLLPEPVVHLEVFHLQMTFDGWSDDECNSGTIATIERSQMSCRSISAMVALLVLSMRQRMCVPHAGANRHRLDLHRRLSDFTFEVRQVPMKIMSMSVCAKVAMVGEKASASTAVPSMS